jgi:hypothetical protein
MPNQAYLEIIDLDGNVAFHPLDPGRGITTIGRHIENKVVIGHPNAAPFHAVLDHRRKPYQIIVLSDGGETKLGGRPLSPGTSTAVRGRDTLEVAGYTLILFEVFEEDEAAAQAGLVGAPASPPVALATAAASPGPIATALLEARPRRPAVLTQWPSASLVGSGLKAFITVCLVILIGLMFYQIVTGATTDGVVQSNERGKIPSVNSSPRHSEATSVVLAENRAGEVNTDEMTYEAMFKEIAQDHNLDWRLLAEQAYQESRLDPLAMGDANEIGLMQILPATWNEWAPKVGASDPWDPYSNVLVAADYLVFLKEYCGDMGYPGDDCMLIAYNWGPYNVRQLFDNGGSWAQVPAEIRRYVLDILQATEADAVNHLAGLPTCERLSATSGQVAVR